MSVDINNSNYIKICNNDPSYQVMTRITDTNNICDIEQRYIKNGTKQNDFETQLRNFKNNTGILCDGKPIDKRDFFTDTIKIERDGKVSVIGTTTKYFKFKANLMLDNPRYKKYQDTYIIKTVLENTFDTKKITSIEEDGKEKISYGFSDKRSIKEKQVSSYPLQRLDKLLIHELPSFFLYINGEKIPDDEIYVYSSKLATDIFIPEYYIGGDLNDEESFIDDTFYVEVRQPGSESIYYSSKKFTGDNIVLDLNDERFSYNTINNYKNANVDNTIIFINGLLYKAKDVVQNDKIINIMLNDICYNESKIEIYVLNDIINRYKLPKTSMLNSVGSRVNFYLGDEFAKTITGPLTKTAVSFFYDHKKIYDSKIEQTSRFSFEYIIDLFTYVPISDKSLQADPTKKYYIFKNNEYIWCKDIVKLDPNTIYYFKVKSNKFDESKIDYFIEDINLRIDDDSYKTLGDDYYLLNMLGIKRCVDNFKNTNTYSIFDEPRYKVDFRKALSNNGDLFDIHKAIEKYNIVSKLNDKNKILSIIKDRPVLIKDLLNQFKYPSKKFIVVGNDKDLTLSSISKIDDVNSSLYYKIYINHILIAPIDYSIERVNKYDYITVPKKFLKEGINQVELYEYDLTYKEKSIFKDNINRNFVKKFDEDGNPIYVKTYKIEDLPFGDSFIPDDLCALEKINKNWYSSNNKEYYLVYTKDNYGYRLTKSFKVISKNDKEISIEVRLNEPELTNGDFYIMCKQYNVVETRIFENDDNSYMIDNDLLVPIYSKYIEYSYDSNGNKQITIDDYIPYINNSEPIISRNGKELLYGKDYTYINPENNDEVTTSFIVFKNQSKVGDKITCQFNSAKTNILIVGYDDLSIDNRYGLIYLSELKYPVSPDYMNIIINGEKLTSMDVDVLSDKLIRVKNIIRPIKTILITTNIIYKESEIQEYLDLYKESEFEKTLEQIFWNCDPSKKINDAHPNIDYVYKVNPYYSDFVGKDEKDYKNTYYENYINDIYNNANKYNKDSIFEEFYPVVDKSENDYDLKLEAWDNAKKFFNIYKHNHGFINTVDSLNQQENGLFIEDTVTYLSDTIEVMYVNWLINSGKTRSYGINDEDIDSLVLKYFSIFENTIIDNRIDIVVDPDRLYEGMEPDVSDGVEIYLPEDVDRANPIFIYPGMEIDLKRKFFYEMLVKALDKRESGNEYHINSEESENETQDLMDELCGMSESNILYPDDFPLEADSDGIMWTGTDYDIVNDYENPNISEGDLN